MIKLWGRKSSSNVQVVLWCLHELGLDYERIDAGFSYGVTDTDAYLKMNPNGLVPTIQIDDHPPMFESGAIMRCLSNQYGSDTFWPTDKTVRAQVDMWAEWAKINVAMNFTVPLFWPLVRMKESMRNPGNIASANKTLETYLTIANDRLAESEFLVTNNLTLADIQLGHVLYRYYDIDLERTPFEHLRRYYDTLTGREGYRSTVMVSYEELRYKPAPE